MALSASSIERIKRYIGWENKPNGAVAALAEMVIEETVRSSHEEAMREKEPVKSYEDPRDHAHIQE